MLISKFKFVVLLVGIFSSLQLWAKASTSDIHLSFQERVMSAYALTAYQKSEPEKAIIYAKAFQYFQKLSQLPAETIQVANFNEFLKSYRGEWPDSGSLAKDIQRVESQPLKGLAVYKSPSARVQAQIDKYLKTHGEYFKKMSVASQGSQGPVTLSYETVLAAFNETVEKNLAEFDTIGTKIAASAFDSIPDPLDRLRLRILFDQYYSLQSLDTKKQIISEFLGQKMELNDQEKFEVMIQNSGPQFQKLLQVIIRQNGISAELKKTFQVLENKVKPVPAWQVEELIRSERSNFQFTYFEKKALGVGTMAQVHRAKLMIDGKSQNVVVRFMKPDIAARVDEDHRILTQVATIIDNNAEYRQLKGPLMAPLMADISQTVRAELDTTATIKRQIFAKTVYDSHANIRTGDFRGDIEFLVPKIFGADTGSKLMIQEMAFGKSLDKEAVLFKDLAPELKKSVIEEVAKLWANEVIFGSGFYHSDLHQGNFLVRVTEPKVQVTLLDYGMGGFLPEGTQRLLLLLGVALQSNNAELITDVYWNISDSSKNQISRADFSRKVQQRLKKIKQDRVPQDMFEWTGWASNEGLKLPYNFINLNRGILIINKSLEEAGSELDFNKIVKSLALKNPTKVAQAIHSSSLVRWSDLITVAFSSEPPRRAVQVSCEAVFSH